MQTYCTKSPPPTSVEEYVQEAGKAGRDGIRAETVLYQGKTFAPRSYQTDTKTCRRRNLFQDFISFFDKCMVVSAVMCVVNLVLVNIVRGNYS